MIIYNNYQYEIKILDSTHLAYRIMGLSKDFCIPLHIAQLNDDFRLVLDEHGFINERGSFND